VSQANERIGFHENKVKPKAKSSIVQKDLKILLFRFINKLQHKSIATQKRGGKD
jgi:hypothetical protein